MRYGITEESGRAHLPAVVIFIPGIVFKNHAGRDMYGMRKITIPAIILVFTSLRLSRFCP
jgi:hypothetical protein